MKYVYSLLILACIWSSCGPQPIIDQHHEIKEYWSYNEVHSFDLASMDTIETYDLILQLTHNEAFGYQNLYLNIKTIYPDNKTVEDIVSLELTDGKGQYLGKCRGSNCTTDIMLQESFKFKQNGRHVIEIQQYSRINKLKGIEGIGIQLLKHDSKS